MTNASLGRPPETTDPHVRWATTINVGSLAEKAIIAGVAIFFYVTSAGQKVDQTAQQLATFKSDIVSKLAETQADNRNRFDELSRAVASLPDQSASLRLLDARVTRLETARTDRDRQIEAMNAVLLQDHAILATMEMANRPKLGLAPR